MTSNLLPLTAAEADRMLAAGAEVEVDWLQGLGRGRTYLCDEWPTGAEPRVGYEQGWVIPPHD